MLKENINQSKMENQEIEIVKYMMSDERLKMKHVLMKYNIERK
jgi:hypothetical protein